MWPSSPHVDDSPTLRVPERWNRCHRGLVASHGWGPTCYGYRWQAGDVAAVAQFPASLPAPIVTAYQLYRASRSLSMVRAQPSVAMTLPLTRPLLAALALQLSPMSFLAWSSAEAAVQAGGRIMGQVRRPRLAPLTSSAPLPSPRRPQFASATHNAREHASYLAGEIARLHDTHGCVTIRRLPTAAQLTPPLALHTGACDSLRTVWAACTRWKRCAACPSRSGRSSCTSAPQQ